MANEMTDYAALKLAANVIKNEVEDSANTAERVGTEFVQLIEAVNTDISKHNVELQHVDALRGLEESLSYELLGRYPLTDVALYDDSVSGVVENGTKVVLTKLDSAAGYESFGVAIPTSLTNGTTYRVCGTFTNNTEYEANLAIVNTLYTQGATKSYLYYHCAAGASVEIDNTFEYVSGVTRYIIVEPLKGEGKSASIELHIQSDTGRVPVLEEKVEALEDTAAEHTAELAKLNEFDDDVYTDVYGEKRLIDAAAYDEQVDIEIEGGALVMTANTESTGAPHYGFKLPDSLVDGEEYTIKGEIINNTHVECPVGNYTNTYPSGQTPNFWLAYNIPVGTTATIDYKFTYDADYPYILVSKSILRYVGDSVTMRLYIAAGEDILGRVEALEGDGVPNTIASVFTGVSATDGSLLALLNSGTNAGWTFTQETNGVRCVASGSTGTYKDDGIALFPEYAGEMKPATKYGVFLDIESETIPLNHAQDTLYLTFFFKATGVSNNASVRIREGEILDTGFTRRLQSVGFIETGASSVDFQYIRCVLTKMNTTGTTDTITNILIKRFIVFEITEPYEDYTELDFVALLKNAGEFSTLAVVPAARMAHANLLYDGQKLKSLGDSLPETRAFQPLIAQTYGMKYDATEEVTTQSVTWHGATYTAYKSVLGGTRVVPVIRGTAESQASNGSIYMRARSLKYYDPDVVIILAGYNDVHAGEAYISGGTATEPADYGIYDDPYTGDEIDLLSDPTAAVPSFGASYRGMIVQLLQDMPFCRFVLCGIPRGSGETSLFGTANDWVAAKNEVIEYIANQYGLPFVDLSKVYGVNAYNYEWLTKDGLHFSDFGGRRVAQEIIAKAF